MAPTPTDSIRASDWRVDGHRPDLPSIVGGAICLVGVAVIMYWPRS